MTYEKMMTWANTLLVACNTIDGVEVKGVSNMDKMLGIHQALDQMAKQMMQEAQELQEAQKAEEK